MVWCRYLSKLVTSKRNCQQFVFVTLKSKVRSFIYEYDTTRLVIISFIDIFYIFYMIYILQWRHMSVRASQFTDKFTVCATNHSGLRWKTAKVRIYYFLEDMPPIVVWVVIGSYHIYGSSDANKMIDEFCRDIATFKSAYAQIPQLALLHHSSKLATSNPQVEPLCLRQAIVVRFLMNIETVFASTMARLVTCKSNWINLCPRTSVFENYR